MKNMLKNANKKLTHNGNTINKIRSSCHPITNLKNP